MLGDGVVDSLRKQLPQDFASDLAFVASAHDRRGCVARTEAGDSCSLAVLLADAIVRAANLCGLDLDSDLLASWRDVYEFSFHFCGFSSMVRKGGLEPPHLSVPDPKSGASANSATFACKSAVKNSTEDQPPINADDDRRSES